MAMHSSVLAWRIPMDREAWWATVHGVTKSWTRLNDFDFSTVNGTRYSTVFTLAGQLQIVIPTVLVICCCITSYHRTNWAETILTTYHRTHFVGVRNLEAV